jgi:hypothetical protein
MQKLTDWLQMRPHYRHEQEGFEVVGSHNMQKFNAQFTKSNVGSKQATFARVFNCDKRKISAFYAKCVALLTNISSNARDVSMFSICSGILHECISLFV